MMQSKVRWAKDSVIRSALASKLAYVHDARKTRLLHGTLDCGNNCKVIDAKAAVDAHAYVWKSGVHSYLVAFRGSQSINDMAKVARDVFCTCSFSIQEDVVQIPCTIFDMFQNLEQQLSSSISSKTVRKITFCGHSLGGAIANIMAAYYASIYPNMIVECHTFGAPKFSDPAFYKWRAKRVQEVLDIVDSRDVIPQIILGNPLKFINNSCEIVLNFNGEAMCILEAHDLETYIKTIFDGIEESKTET